MKRDFDFFHRLAVEWDVEVADTDNSFIVYLRWSGGIYRLKRSHTVALAEMATRRASGSHINFGEAAEAYAAKYLVKIGKITITESE